MVLQLEIACQYAVVDRLLLYSWGVTVVSAEDIHWNVYRVHSIRKGIVVWMVLCANCMQQS